jgi:hypothetical protein
VPDKQRSRVSTETCPCLLLFTWHNNDGWSQKSEGDALRSDAGVPIMGRYRAVQGGRGRSRAGGHAGAVELAGCIVRGRYGR